MSDGLLPIVKGKKFIGGKVNIDGNRYEDCIFSDCEIEYAGGPAEFSRCGFFGQMKYTTTGSAAIVVRVFQALGIQILAPTFPPT